MQGGHDIQKPTNARHVVHVTRDPVSGGLLLVRGEEVVKLTGDDELATYTSMLTAMHDAADVTATAPGGALAFPPRNAIPVPQPLQRQLSSGGADDSDEEASDSDSDRAPSPAKHVANATQTQTQTQTQMQQRPKSPELSASATKARDKATSGAPIDPLKAPVPDRDGRFKGAPEIGRFTSPYHQPQPSKMAGNGRGGVDLTLSESDTLDSTLEEERRTLQQAKKNRRDKLIAEFVRTESIHVEALKSVIVDYLAPLRESKILNAQQQKNLFSNIELILMWNMDFLQMLKDRLLLGRSGSGSAASLGDRSGARSIGEEVCFGDIFVKSSVILRQLFTQYNQSYALAQHTYQELLKNKDFEQFIQLKSAQKDSRTNLLTSLYLPIQRMIMYDSLLKEILNLTPPTHADFDNLTAAYKLLRSMDKAATRAAEKRKNMDTVLRIQNQLTGSWDIAQPHRSYVFEEQLLLVVGKALKERVLYLFNDLLLLAKEKKKNKYEVERALALDKIEVDSYDDDRHLFKLSIPAEEEVYWFHSENKLSWVQLLQSTKKKLHAPPVEINDLLEEEFDYQDTQKSSSFERDLLNAGAVPLTKKMLKAKILKWSRMDDPAQIQRQVRKAARMILAYEQLSKTHGLSPNDASEDEDDDAADVALALARTHLDDAPSPRDD